MPVPLKFTTTLSGSTLTLIIASDPAYGASVSNYDITLGYNTTLASFVSASAAPGYIGAFNGARTGTVSASAFVSDGGDGQPAGSSLTILTFTLKESTADFPITLSNTALNEDAPASGSADPSVPPQENSPCYCLGTLILTDRGEQPIEALAIGDRVVTAIGTVDRIRWIGRRSYDGAFIAGNHLMLPVQIKAGALGPGVPRRDLYVSPGHAMFLHGQLVPAWRLINGESIVQAGAVASVTYYHVDLGCHAVIFAEGAPAESFLDDGCRGQFQNSLEFELLYAGGVAVIPLQRRLEDGFGLQAIQERLAARAGVSTLVEPIGPLRGFVDMTNSGRVTGWAQDVDSPEEPVALEISAGGIAIVCVLANGYRADLRQADLGSGCHAFDFFLPAKVHGRIEVRRVTDGSGLALTVAASASDVQRAA